MNSLQGLILGTAPTLGMANPKPGWLPHVNRRLNVCASLSPFTLKASGSNGFVYYRSSGTATSTDAPAKRDS